MAEHGDTLYVTSHGDQGILVLDQDGEQIDMIIPNVVDQSAKQSVIPNQIAISGDGQCAFTCLHSKKVYLMTLTTHHTQLVSHENIQCPSALLFDAFGNLLIADFTSDSIHLVASGHGLYYGKLLTKRHGIACPNALAFDSDGHLLVAQYGGDVLVVRYRSFEKRL